LHLFLFLLCILYIFFRLNIHFLCFILFLHFTLFLYCAASMLTESGSQLVPKSTHPQINLFSTVRIRGGIKVRIKAKVGVRLGQGKLNLGLVLKVRFALDRVDQGRVDLEPN